MADIGKSSELHQYPLYQIGNGAGVANMLPVPDRQEKL